MLIWVITAAALLWWRWAQIHWFSLGDTDDNMRMMQVRGLLNGQGWYDLRQYRLNPPEGFNIHWSRIVDLPLAAIILITKPFVGGGNAERIAVAIAPLLPLYLSLLSIGASARKLITPNAFILAVVLFVLAPSALSNFGPTRIDHHGWQLTMMALMTFGMVHDDRRWGGTIVGFAMAFSMTIGLEMIPYILVGGAALVLRWIVDPRESERLTSFGVAIAGTMALGFVIFASNDNRVPRCDAGTPVWLSTVAVAGTACVLLGWVKTQTARARFGLALLGGGAIDAFYALAWPHCLGQLENTSPELNKLWLSGVSEAQPLYKHKMETIVTTLSLPLMGFVGHSVALWQRRGDRDRFLQWIPLAFLALIAMGLLFHQSRVAPAAQLFALLGTAQLAWTVVPMIAKSRHMLVRVLGIPASFLLFSGAGFGMVYEAVAPKDPKATSKIVNRANAKCPTLPALRPIGLLPKATIFTFVDLGPRLITVTHHDAVAGPYHRNGEAILDVKHAFLGTPDAAHALINKHKATMLLICPNLSEGTSFQTAAPNGFYVQLVKGKIPNWLEPVTLPKNSPYLLWRVKP